MDSLLFANETHPSDWTRGERQALTGMLGRIVERLAGAQPSALQLLTTNHQPVARIQGVLVQEVSVTGMPAT